MKRLFVTTIVILLVGSACTWFGYRLGKSPAIPKAKELTTSVLDETLFEYLINKIKISHFEADGIPMDDALSLIERKINENFTRNSFDLRAKVSNQNLSDDKVTIVVRDTSVKTILNLISEQTHFQYRIYGSKQEVVFFFNTDIITYGNDQDEVTPTILPPPGQLPE